MRLGAMDPNSRNVELEPGPPLKMKVTGRVGSVAPWSSTALNAAKKILAAGLTLAVSMVMVPRVAS